MRECSIVLSMLFLPLSIHVIAAVRFTAQPLLVDYFPFLDNDERSHSSLENFIASESPVALRAILNNTGFRGAMTPGVEAGLVIASPSKANPDCQCLSLSYSNSYTIQLSHSLFSAFRWVYVPLKAAYSPQYDICWAAVTYSTVMLIVTFYTKMHPATVYHTYHAKHSQHL